MSELIQPNLILPTGYEQARDILMDLHAVLRKYKAELFFRKEQRAMLLWVSDGSKEVYGGYLVVGLLHRITPVGALMDQNTIRPGENYAKAEDILLSMREVLVKHRASLIFDVAKEGMHLRVTMPSYLLGEDVCELAIVRNITRFGAELNKANFETVRIPAPFSEEDTAAVRKWLKGGKL